MRNVARASMLMSVISLAAVISLAGAGSARPAPPKETDLGVYRAVLSAAQKGGFERIALSGPMLLLRTTEIERFGPVRISDLPSHYREAIDHLESRTDVVYLDDLANERISLSDTLDRTLERCNVVFSQIGYNSGKDAAVCLFTFGCKNDTVDVAQSLLVFLSWRAREWIVDRYWDIDESPGSRGIATLQRHFALKAWEVPSEAYEAAREHVKSERFKQNIRKPEDAAGIRDDQIEFAVPYVCYAMTDSSFMVLARSPNPDPLQHALHDQTWYEFPYYFDGFLHGWIRVWFARWVGYVARGLTPSTLRPAEAERMRNRRDVSQLLGLIRLARPFGGSRWAYVDNSGAFRTEEAITDAWLAGRAEFVVVATLRNRESRVIAVTQQGGPLGGSRGYTRHYDVGELEIEKVLKGRYSTTRMDICFPSPPLPGQPETLGSESVNIENGEKRIWFLIADPTNFLPYHVVPDASYVMGVEHTDAVTALLPDPPPRAIDHPMTRGKEWNADLTGKKGVTVFFILGALDEYICRSFVEDGDFVEKFGCGQEHVSEVFNKYLVRLTKEQGLHTDIRTETNGCVTSYYSRELSDFIGSFYDYSLNTPDDGSVAEDKLAGAACLTKEAFAGLGRDVVFAYLAGAYVRYGHQNTFEFSNSARKVTLIRELLEELGCATRMTSGETIPVRNRVGFEPSEELKMWFEELP